MSLRITKSRHLASAQYFYVSADPLCIGLLGKVVEMPLLERQLKRKDIGALSFEDSRQYLAFFYCCLNGSLSRQ